MKKLVTSFGALVAAATASAAFGMTPPAITGAASGPTCPMPANAGKTEWVREPSDQVAVTHHHFSAGGKSFDYTATAGTMAVRDDDDRPIANIGYIAYGRDQRAKTSARPIVFAFNGGPGSSSMFLHMGMLGPKRVLVADAAATPPAPYGLVDNAFTMLDTSDLVLIDPVGSGLSHALCGKKDSDFWSVDADTESIGRFITRYASDNDRWNSPKYIMGESYGTIRASTVANYLRSTRSLNFNGIILVSMATDIEMIYTDLPGNDRPYFTYLPALAAAAWYHHMVPNQPADLLPFLAEVRRYSEGPFATALMRGNSLSETEQDVVADKVHGYTGLPVDYIKASKFKISEFAFAQELLRFQGKTVSRLDSRFSGSSQDPLEKSVTYDPILSYVEPAYAAPFLDYYHRDLKAGIGQNYQIYNTAAGNNWTWSHKVPGSAGEQQILVNAGVDLAQTIVQDPNLKVIVLSGYFDLGSPFSAVEYMVSHLNIPLKDRDRVRIAYYEAGHLIYINISSLKKMKSDLDTFIATTH